MPSDNSQIDNFQKSSPAPAAATEADRVQTFQAGDSRSTASQGDNTSVGAQVFASMIADQGRDKLLQGAAKGISNADELKQFKLDAGDFESRAQKANLSPAEINATYEQIGRLLSGTGESPLSASQRCQLAEQVMHQAAQPTSISQGDHNTCNLTTVEVRTYTKYPSAAAKLVSDVALNGQYTSPGGLKVDFGGSLADSREPHGQAKTNPAKNGERSFASQLFQVTGINLHYQKLAKSDPDGFFQYEQHEAGYVAPGSKLTDASPDGEVLVAYHDDGKAEVVAWNPVFGADEMTEVMNDITGKNEKGFVLEHKDGVTAKSTTVIDTPSKLDATLAHMKDAGQLPAIIVVADSDVLFSNYGSVGPHVVNVTDYDKNKKTVAVANEAGSEDNYLGEKSLRMTDVYRSTIGSADSDSDRKARVTRDFVDRNQNRAKGTVDSAIEWDYVRDKLMAGTTAPESKLLARDVQDALAHTGPVWQKEIDQGTLDDREARVAVRGMAEAIAWLDGPQIQALISQPYWKAAAALMKRFPDQVAISGLDDSRKAILAM